MSTYWDQFIDDKLTGVKCGTCGTTMMPDGVKLRLYHEWLSKRGKIVSPEEEDAHTKTLGALQDTQAELLNLKRENKELQKRVLEARNGE